MAYDDLRDWIKTLEKHGELKRISEEVSPELEITEITDRVSRLARGAGQGARAGNTLPAALRSCLKMSRAIPATRSSSTSSAASAAWLSLSASSVSTKSPSASAAC